MYAYQLFFKRPSPCLMCESSRERKRARGRETRINGKSEKQMVNVHLKSLVEDLMLSEP